MVTNDSARRATAPGGHAARQLEGQWRNQHGSELLLSADEHGGLRGTYRLASEAGDEPPNQLIGSYDDRCSRAGSVLGFVVVWNDARSVTVWSGQYHPGEDVIRTTWLMTNETVFDDDWHSTMIGEDIFVRN